MQSERDLALTKLEMQLKPCVRHNNPARIELMVDQIVCKYCYCYMKLADWGTWEEAVEQWNDRPAIDSLVKGYAEEIKANGTLRARMRVLVEQGEIMANVIVEMRARKVVYLPDQERAYLSANWFRQLAKEGKTGE